MGYGSQTVTRCSRTRQNLSLVPPSGDVAKHTHRVWFWPIRSIIWKHDVIRKTESQDWAMATGNMYKKHSDIRTCRFWNRPADRHTDRQTWTHADGNISHPYRILSKIRSYKTFGIFWIRCAIHDLREYRNCIIWSLSLNRYKRLTGLGRFVQISEAPGSKTTDTVKKFNRMQNETGLLYHEGASIVAIECLTPSWRETVLWLVWLFMSPAEA